MGNSYENLLIDSDIQLWSFFLHEESENEPETINRYWIYPIKFI